MSVNELQSTVVTYLFHDQWRDWRTLWFSEHHQERFVMLGWSELAVITLQTQW